jgi:hypothetical protein
VSLIKYKKGDVNGNISVDEKQLNDKNGFSIFST